MPKSLAHAPRTLWALVAIAIIRLAVGPALGSVRAEFFLYGAVFTLVLLYFLLRGSRFVWWLLVVTMVAGIALSLRADHAWLDIPLSLLEIGLLLAPQTRRYVFRPRPGQQKPPKLERFAPPPSAGGGQPSGWYPDPARPGWVRYWQSEDEAWLGSAKAPGRRRSRLPLP